MEEELGRVGDLLELNVKLRCQKVKPQYIAPDTGTSSLSVQESLCTEIPYYTVLLFTATNCKWGKKIMVPFWGFYVNMCSKTGHHDVNIHVTSSSRNCSQQWSYNERY
jgi:hypothetical protein